MERSVRLSFMCLLIAAICGCNRSDSTPAATPTEAKPAKAGDDPGRISDAQAITIIKNFYATFEPKHFYFHGASEKLSNYCDVVAVEIADRRDDTELLARVTLRFKDRVPDDHPPGDVSNYLGGLDWMAGEPRVLQNVRFRFTHWESGWKLADDIRNARLDIK